MIDPPAPPTSVCHADVYRVTRATSPRRKFFFDTVPSTGKVPRNLNHNGDDVFIAWKPDGLIPECRGFALMRRRNGVEEVVSTWVGFTGQSHEEGDRRASTNWPIQKYQWTDYMANPGDKLPVRRRFQIQYIIDISEYPFTDRNVRCRGNNQVMNSEVGNTKVGTNIPSFDSR